MQITELEQELKAEKGIHAYAKTLLAKADAENLKLKDALRQISMADHPTITEMDNAEELGRRLTTAAGIAREAIGVGGSPSSQFFPRLEREILKALLVLAVIDLQRLEIWALSSPLADLNNPPPVGFDMTNLPTEIQERVIKARESYGMPKLAL